MRRQITRWGMGLGLAAGLGACTQAQVPAGGASAPVARAAQQASPAVVSATAPLAAAPAPSVAPANAPAAPQGPAAAIELAKFTWGQAKFQLGRVLEGEQNPEGPMALDADGDGRLWILDQVNERLVRLDRQGGWHAIPAPRTAQELAVDGAGHVWVLDRLVGKQLQRLDTQSGAVVQSVRLHHPQDEPWLITALQIHGGALWAEYEHAQLRRVTGSGLAVLEGRPTADNRWLLKALRVPPNRAALAGRSLGRGADLPPELALQVEFSMPVAQLVEVAGQSAEQLWVVADLVQLDDQDRPVQRRREAVVLDSAGRELRRVALCAPEGPLEQLRSARLGRDGHLYSLCVGDKGVLVQEVAL